MTLRKTNSSSEIQMKQSKLSQAQPCSYFLAPCVSSSFSPVSLIDVLPKGESNFTQQRKTKHLYYTILGPAPNRCHVIHTHRQQWSTKCGNMVLQGTFHLSLHQAPIPTHPGGVHLQQKLWRRGDQRALSRLRNKAFPPPNLKETKESGLREACWWSFSLPGTTQQRESNGWLQALQRIDRERHGNRNRERKRERKALTWPGVKQVLGAQRLT